MKAMVLRKHGGIDELVLEESWPKPCASRGNVVISVKACALNYHDLFTIRGMPGIELTLPVVIGLDMAGVVVEVGADVSEWAVGDRVLVDPLDRLQGKLIGEALDGGLAEYCEVGSHTLISLPDSVSFVDAAALPVAYGTAYRMMITRGAVKRGEKILVLGAAGGVGSCCVQLGRLSGAHVIAAASNDMKLAELEALGASEGINYRAEDFVQVVHNSHGKPRVWGDGGVDVVVNFTGGDTWVSSLRTLRKGGRVLTCGATAGFDPPTDLRYIWTFELNVLGSNGWEREDLQALLERVQAGSLSPLIGEVTALGDAREGLRLLQDRRVVGKVVVEP